MTQFENSLLSVMHSAAQLTREQIWRGETIYWPTVRKDFAQYPQLAFVGRDYEPGGCILVGANPNSTEGQGSDLTEERYAAQDRENVVLMKAFLTTASLKNFNHLNDFRRKDIKSWAMDWCISGTLDRMGLPLDQIALCNVIPFSTQEAPKARSLVWKNSVDLYFAGLLDLLRPQRVVWLGKAGHERSGAALPKHRPWAEAVISRQRNISKDARFEDLQKMMLDEV